MLPRLSRNVRTVLVILGGFIAAGSLSPAACRSDEQLRIGSWNIEQLGSPDYRSPPARDIAQHPVDLARHILKARVDILALQEIGDTDGEPETRSSATLDKTFDILNQLSGHDWDYLLFPKKEPRETFQLTGVAWNREKVRQVGAPWKLPLVDDRTDAFDTWHRAPHALQFSAGEGRTDFVLVPIHMKSNVGGDVTVRQRAAEARELAARLARLRQHFGDEDIVLLGDFNCLRGDEPAMRALLAAGFRDLNAADQPTTWLGGRFEPAPFDRILVPRGQPEFDESRQRVLTPTSRAAHREHKRRLSDHHLITTLVRILPDDDQRQAEPPPTDPPPQPDRPPATLRIVRLVPNPEGPDDAAESVAIRNLGDRLVDLAGWKLRDDDGPDRTWPLRGTLRPGQELVFLRPASGFQMGNGGDTIRLFDPRDRLIHEVRYSGPVPSGKQIVPGASQGSGVRGQGSE